MGCTLHYICQCISPIWNLDPPMSRLMYDAVSSIQGMAVSRNSNCDDWFNYARLKLGAWFKKQFYLQPAGHYYNPQLELKVHWEILLSYSPSSANARAEKISIYSRGNKAVIQVATNRKLQQIAVG